MDATAVLIVVMILMLALAVRISIFMSQRAFCTVIGAFRNNNALTWQNAQTLKELDLEPVLFRILRDYRPYAIQALQQADIIRPTPDGRFYLAEENLDQVRIKCKR